MNNSGVQILGKFLGAALAFVFISCLGSGPATTIEVQVPVPNPNPVFVGLHDTTIFERQPLSFGLFGTDPQNDSLAFSILGPRGSTLTLNLFAWTPDEAQAGVHLIRFIARARNSPQRADTAHIVVTVRDVPVPALLGLHDTLIQEGQTLSFALTVNDTAATGIVYSMIGPQGATLVDNIFTWIPGATQAGSYTIHFIARVAGDSLRADTTSITVFVADHDTTSTSLAPVLKTLRDTAIDEGQPLSLTLSAVPAAGRTVAYSLLGPPGSSLSGATFTWTPNYTQSGTHPLRFIAYDPAAPANADTLFVAVTVRDFPITQIPELTAPRDTSILKGQALSLTLAASDPRSLGLTYSVLGPAGASVTGNVFHWTPTAAQTGQHLIRFIVRDNGSTPRGDTAYAVITVMDYNLSPVLQALRDTAIDEGQPIKFILLATDAEGDALTYSVTGAPGGSFTGNTFNWTPDTAQAGTYVLRFVAAQTNDPTKRDSAQVTLTVRDVVPEPIPVGALAAYWNFNEGSGVVLADLTGGGRNATVYGTPTWVPGVQGTGMRFSGVSSNYAESTTPFPDMTEQTLSAWVYLDQVSYASFVFDGNGDGAQDNMLGIQSTGQVYYRTRDVDPKGQILGKTRLQASQWYYVAATCKADTVKIYVNAVLDTVKTGAGAFNLSGHHYRTEIGRVNDGGGHNEAFTKGILDELRIYNKALSAAQILQEWNRLRANVGR